jgi:hypothetical protein
MLGYMLAAIRSQTRLLLLFSICLVATDVLLLAYLAFGSPCISCLIVGILIFILFFLAWQWHFGQFFAGDSWTGLRRSAVVVCGLWIGVAAPNLLGVVQETVAPMPIYGSNDAPIKIFFSPTCPACKDMVRRMVRNNEDKTALYPVAHNEEDVERMCILDCTLDRGADLKEALNKCWRGECSMEERGFWQKVRLTLISQINQSFLLDMGKKEVPVLVSRTAPEPAPAQPGVDIEFDSSGSSPVQQKQSSGCGFGQQDGCSIK